jgi:hypothetical protein
VIQNTLFYDYINEREGKRIIEDERGFLVFKVINEECFIAEGYVREAERGSSAFSDLLRHLFVTAQSDGCKVVTATIHLADVGAMRTLKAVLKRGFRVCSANNDVLLIMKEV